MCLYGWQFFYVGAFSGSVCVVSNWKGIGNALLAAVQHNMFGAGDPYQGKSSSRTPIVPRLAACFFVMTSWEVMNV